MDTNDLHLSVFLERVEIFECQRCSKMFGDQTLLDYHMLSHNEQLNMFDTAMNIVTFDAKVVLDRVPIHECTECTRGFLSDWDYQYHKLQHLRRKHNNISKSETTPPAEDGDENDDKYRKIYECEECDARFVLYSTLLAHMVLHKPFDHTCHCGIGYYKEQDLKTHKKLVHSNTVPKKSSWKPKINLSVDTILRMKPKKPRRKIEKSDRYDDIVEDEDDEEETAKIDIGPPLATGRPRLNRQLKYRKPTYLMTEMTSETTPKASSVDHEGDDDGSDEDTKKVDESDEDETYDPSSKKKKGPKLKVELVYKKPPKKRTVKSVENQIDQCLVCYKTFRPGNLKRHTMEVHGTDKPYRCDECGKCFSMAYLLKSHKNVKHDVKKKKEKRKPSYPCTICNKVLTRALTLESHMMLHTGESRYECEICGKKFVNKLHFNMHIEKHSNRKYPCPTCGKEFALLLYMQNHTRIHLQVKPFSCKFCKRGFADPSALKRHERIHTGEKPYECKFCSKRFSDASAQIVHVRRHTGVKNFECEWCSKRFYVLSDLKLHVTSVHGDGDRKFECDLCQKAFYLKQHLVTHMKIAHLETKRQKCKYCPKTFSSFYMKSHLYKEHDVRLVRAVKHYSELVKNEM